MPASADLLLTRFHEDRAAALHAEERDRLDRLLCDLRLAVEVEGEALLDPDDAVLLAAERQFRSPGAVGRIADAAVLVQVLRHFAADPAWAADDAVEARVRVDECLALLRALAGLPELTGRARLLRRAEEALRVRAGELSPLRPRLRRPRPRR